MPRNIAHMNRDDYPVTPETIRLALEEQAREREKARRECGIDFDGDRVVIPTRKAQP